MEDEDRGEAGLQGLVDGLVGHLTDRDEARGHGVDRGVDR